MTEDIKKAKVYRRTAKAALTRIGRSLIYLVEQGRPVAEVEEELEKFRSAYLRLEERQEKLTSLLDDTEFEVEEAVMEESQQQFLEITVRTKDFIKSKAEAGEKPLKTNSQEPTATGPSEETPDSNEAVGACGSGELGKVSRVSMTQPSKPKFKSIRPKLPLFSGDVRTYHEFKSDFKYMVERDFDDRDAVTMLRSALEGKPLEMVRGFGQDYEAVWETLDAVYGDPRCIADAVTQDIMKFKGLQEGDDARFCELAQLVRRCYKLLKEVGRVQDMDNNYVIALLEQKLCSEDRKLWTRQLEIFRIRATLENLLDWMTVEMRVRLRTSYSIRSSNPVRPARSSVTQISLSKDGEKAPKCWLCKSESHFIDGCAEFLAKDAKERFKIIKDNHCCFSCLKRAGKNHRASTCMRRKPCSEMRNGSQCKSFHHKLLHVQDFGSSLVGMAPVTRGECLLPIATLDISGRRARRNCNVLLDSGAQVSLIREALAKEMKLSGKDMKVSIVKVGGEESELHTKIYDVTVHSFWQ